MTRSRRLWSAFAALALTVAMVVGAVGPGAGTAAAQPEYAEPTIQFEPDPAAETEQEVPEDAAVPGETPPTEPEPESEPVPVETVPADQAPGEFGDPARTAVEADPRSNDIWVPDWVLLLIALAAIVAAVTVATQSYLRFSQTRKNLEG